MSAENLILDVLIFVIFRYVSVGETKKIIKT